MIKYLLYPFAILYDAVTTLRNKSFDLGLKPTMDFEISSIGVGNLNVGGTGKTPMIEYLIRLLKDEYSVVTLSRGYKRKTKGYRMAGKNDNAETLGDEPAQFYQKFNDTIGVAVGERRAVAVPLILKDKPDVDLILYDDIFQHRYVLPKLLILLTSYTDPFFEDYLLPAGRLRESRKGANRADVVVVTKCPRQLDLSAQKLVVERIREYNASAPVFFTRVGYANPVGTDGEFIAKKSKVILISGLADASDIEEYVKAEYDLIKHFRYPDHHQYTPVNVTDILSIAKTSGIGTHILTTEKDMVKLKDFKWEGFKPCAVPIEVIFITQEAQFKDIVLSSV